MIDFQNIYPELFLMLAMLFLLLFGVFIKNSFTLIKKGTILSLLICIPIVYINFDNQLLIFNNNYSINLFSNFCAIEKTDLSLSMPITFVLEYFNNAEE